MQLRIGPDQAGRTVKSVLKGELQVSSSLLSRLKQRKGGILLNGKPVFVSAVLQSGDRLAVDLSDLPGANSYAPIPMPLQIRYEDEYLLLIDKPPGLAVHPSTLDLSAPSLAAGLTAYLGQGSVFHAVNRLDKGTSGLMAVAKSAYIHRRLIQQLHTGSFVRQYLGIVLGAPLPPRGVICLPIGRDPDSVIKRRIDPEGVYAESGYKTLRRCGERTLLQLTPSTGRTHQLRLHLSALGHPLAGDWLYGTEDRALISRPALHSTLLQLTHPISGETLRCCAPLPADMKRLLADSIH